jgi:hypothetical protein
MFHGLDWNFPEGEYILVLTSMGGAAERGELTLDFGFG